MKTGIKKLEFQDPDSNSSEAILWKDDSTKDLSIEITSPWDGITSSREVQKLIKFLEVSKSKMEKRGQ